MNKKSGPSNKCLVAFGIFMLSFFLAPTGASAMATPVGAALFPPLEFPLRSSSVIGLRLNLFLGVHESVMGLDLGGIGNMTDRDFGGLQLAGGFNRNKGPVSIYGAQIAGLVNWNLNSSSIYGVQLSAGFNYNYGRGTLVGLGIGGIGNRSPQSIVVGGQIGLYNEAKQVYGIQVGVVNVTQSLHGIQVGLVNVNKSGPLPFFPAINFGL